MSDKRSKSATEAHSEGVESTVEDAPLDRPGILDPYDGEERIAVPVMAHVTLPEALAGETVWMTEGPRLDGLLAAGFVSVIETDDEP